MTWFSSDVISGLESGLNRISLQGETISQNIANVDTPNYKTKKVDFKEKLEHRLQAYRTNSHHLTFSQSAGGGAVVRSEIGTSFNNNGNNVDMDREMASLANTQLRYQALVEQMNSQFTRLKTVLRGGS